MSDVRNDLASLPPLVGTGTELRRQLTGGDRSPRPSPALAARRRGGARRADRRHLGRAPVRPSGHRRGRGPQPARGRGAVARRSTSPTPSRPRRRSTAPRPGRIRRRRPRRLRRTPAGSRPPSYQVTGDSFAADPVYPDGRPAHAAAIGDRRRRGPTPGFRAVPSGGRPRADRRPARHPLRPRRRGHLADDRGPHGQLHHRRRRRPHRRRRTSRSSAVSRRRSPTCPDSERAPGRRPAADGRDGRAPPAGSRPIEDWLLTRRIYDPTAPGGQTLGSVEQFLSPAASPAATSRSFVTTYALLARCAGVPVRVVVGYPGPGAGHDRPTTSATSPPGSRCPWRAPAGCRSTRSPRPPSRSSRPSWPSSRPPTRRSRPTSPPAPPRQVEPPSELPGAGFPWIWVLAGRCCRGRAAGVDVPRSRSWSVGAPAQIADPTAAVLAAWTTVSDELADREPASAPHHTPTEVVRLGAGALPVSVPGLVAGHRADRRPCPLQRRAGDRRGGRRARRGPRRRHRGTAPDHLGHPARCRCATRSASRAASRSTVGVARAGAAVARRAARHGGHLLGRGARATSPT